MAVYEGFPHETVVMPRRWLLVLLQDPAGIDPYWCPETPHLMVSGVVAMLAGFVLGIPVYQWWQRRKER